MKLTPCFGLVISSCIFALAPIALATDLAEVYALAVQNDPQLAAAKASYMATRERVPQARAKLLPQFFIGGKTATNKRTLVDAGTTNNFNDHGWQATLRQPVFQLESWFQFKQAKHIEAQALAQLTAQQQELIFRVADDYLTILQSNDLLVSSNAERDAVKRQLEQVRQRFDVGLVAITDVLESTAAFDASTVHVIEAEGAQNISFESLLRLTGQRFYAVNALAKTFPIKYPEPNNEDAWVSRALENNYSLIAAREGVSAAQRQLAGSRSRHLPRVEAEIIYVERNSGGASFPASEVDQGSASLTLNIPVFSGGAVRSAARQAGFQLEQAQKDFDFAQRTVVENTRGLFVAINTDVARVKARLRGIESSRSALDATQTGYEVGTRNIVDVLLAQQRLYLAQFQYARARYQYILDTFRLKQIVGSLGPDDIYALNEFISQDKVIDRVIPSTR